MHSSEMWAVSTALHATYPAPAFGKSRSILFLCLLELLHGKKWKETREIMMRGLVVRVTQRISR
jgi:hypothetical protein